MKLIQFWPEMTKMEDNMGGLPLHSLCKNTISDEETLMIMFWTLIDAHEEAIFV